MKMLFAVLCALMLSSLAFAAQETQQLGPYTVSFDMNTNMKYQIQKDNPATDARGTYYRLGIISDNTTGATITISGLNDLTDSTLEMWEGMTGYQMAMLGFNASLPTKVVIDGKEGFLMSGVPIPGINIPSGVKLYRASYWTDSKDCECGPVSVGKTKVDISSSYPQDVTESLLNSLHVVKS